LTRKGRREKVEDQLSKLEIKLLTANEINGVVEAFRGLMQSVYNKIFKNKVLDQV